MTILSYTLIYARSLQDFNDQLAAAVAIGREPDGQLEIHFDHGGSPIAFTMAVMEGTRTGSATITADLTIISGQIANLTSRVEALEGGPTG